MDNNDKMNSLDSFKRKHALQQIYYGAPGTGKSCAIKELTKGKAVIRTTFHPDSDYSTFVGAYKPTTVKDEYKIVYEFVPQAFLQAYVAAWKKFDKKKRFEDLDNEYLVIEEINRGNCAQIFGDLFQLLDRGDEGFSEYHIYADTDMKRYLQKALAQVSLEGVADKINEIFKDEVDNMAQKVKEGDVLLLPSNLYIWATMNTSDQSLFPIDSAFKRRWDWQYVPISNAGEKWVIRVNDNDYDWWNFLEKINEHIYKATYSEDKKLGYFFCKANNRVIDAEKFVSKVVFYLWNDVFKDMGFEGDLFKDDENSKLTFDKFYTVEGGKTKVVRSKVEKFFENLGLEPIEKEREEDIKVENEDGNIKGGNSRNYDQYTVNGGPECAKNRLAEECIKEYIKLNPTMSALDVCKTWKPLANGIPHFIETKAEYDARTDNSKRSDPINCLGDILYVVHNGYDNNNGKADELMDSVNKLNWGITVKKIAKEQQ